MTTASSSSSLPAERASRLKTPILLALLVLLGQGVYLLSAVFQYRLGFPLDDSWIHQAYARNLALSGEWALVPGQPSGGSTSPLWSGLLALGFLFGLAPHFWAYLLGGLALWGLALIGEESARSLLPAYRPAFPWAGGLLALEWHLVWSGASGMETILFTLIATALLALVLGGSRRCGLMGLLAGLAVWVRPDGITLLGPALVWLAVDRISWSRRLRALINLAVGFGGLFAPYLLFNWAVAGSPWPNTFYAKQAEYASYLELPLFQRWGAQALQPLIGVGVLLVPGLVILLASAARRRAWRPWLALAWFGGYLALYAWRLPVTYQHGRYVMPAMPVFFLLGLTGLLSVSLEQASRLRRLGVLAWRSAVAAVLLAFLGLGGFTYGRDVAVIESEMVDTARWVAAEIPAGDLVAAHDVGALGYYGNHELVDLAGLVSPEIIQLLGDETSIGQYLDQRGVHYLVAFPDWYQDLTARLTPVFVTEAPYAPSLGQPNMVVYRWIAP
jgi:hypothetical protein